MRYLYLILAAVVLALPTPSAEIDPHESVSALAEAAVDSLVAGDRVAFLRSFALFPSYQALVDLYGDDFAFADDRAGFLGWRNRLASEYQAAAEFYDGARSALMTSSIAIREPVLTRLRFQPGTWFGIEAVDQVLVDVQLTHAIQATFDLGRAARLPSGWAFVQAPDSLVRIERPALVGTGVRWVQLQTLDAALP